MERFFILMLLFCFGCTRTPNRPTELPPLPTPPAKVVRERPDVDPARIPDLVEALNAFSLRLTAQMADRSEGNLLVSPLGSFLLLEILYEGAEGKTKQAMTELLGRTRAGLEEVSLLHWELNALPSLALGQKIFLDTETSVKPEFRKRVEAALVDPIESLPLRTNPEQAQKALADWVARQTGGQLGSDLPAPGESTVAVLLSTLLFRGEWSNKFLGDTDRADFHLADGTTLQVPLMALYRSHLVHFSSETGEGVVLPYTDDTELVLVLPKPDRKPSEIWTELDPRAGLGQSPEDNLWVTVKLPRFQIRTTMTELNTFWEQLGLATKDVDLASMIEGTKIDLFVYHQAVVKVDERGTEAQAVTAIYATPAATGAPLREEPKTIEIVFDRPFLFFLRHSKTGAILLLGEVHQPELWAE